MTNVKHKRGAQGASATFLMMAFAATAMSTGCDLGRITVGTTSGVLKRAQPSLKQESDYTLAARAIPGAIKTIEGFWVVDPENTVLMGILAEGYCQYGTAFVEDEFEVAAFAKKLDEADFQAERATKMYVRCTNYALKLLGKKWQEGIYADQATVEGLIAGAKRSKRDALMWLGLGLGSTINMNKDNMAMIAQLPTARMILERVVEMDEKKMPKDPMKAALPHLGLGLIHTGQSPNMGGQPELGKKHFERAIEISKGPNGEQRNLLARVYYARNYGVIMQATCPAEPVEDAKACQDEYRMFFRNTLIEVLQTPPNIWPEQRLSNEVAHRRARRYLAMEKEWF